MAKELGAPPLARRKRRATRLYDQYHDQAITKSSITRLVDATPSAFPDTRIVVAAGNPEITRQFWPLRRPNRSASEAIASA